MFFLLVLFFSNIFLLLCDMKYGAKSSENIVEVCSKNIRRSHSCKSAESNVEFTIENLQKLFLYHSFCIQSSLLHCNSKNRNLKELDRLFLQNIYFGIKNTDQNYFNVQYILYALIVNVYIN